MPLRANQCLPTGVVYYVRGLFNPDGAMGLEGRYRSVPAGQVAIAVVPRPGAGADFLACSHRPCIFPLHIISHHHLLCPWLPLFKGACLLRQHRALPALCLKPQRPVTIARRVDSTGDRCSRGLGWACGNNTAMSGAGNTRSRSAVSAVPAVQGKSLQPLPPVISPRFPTRMARTHQYRRSRLTSSNSIDIDFAPALVDYDVSRCSDIKLDVS